MWQRKNNRIGLGLGLVAVLAAAILVGLASPARVEAQTAQIGLFKVAPLFTAYYESHQSVRVLGFPLTGQLTIDDHPTQYFEKGRLEDHRSEATSPDWQFMFGRLTAELIEKNAQGPVNNTSMTYADLKNATLPYHRQDPPPGFTGGTIKQGSYEFIPFDSYLRPAPGYLVPNFFWDYINRADLFPGGWLHDIGLPLTQVQQVLTVKNGESRLITIQAFERSVLTLDPLNPPECQVEQGNLGSDMVMLFDPAGTRLFENPATGARVSVPVHLFVRGGFPGEQLLARLSWQDGTKLTNTFTALAGVDGKGLIIGNLGWGAHPQPPTPPTQSAILEIYRQDGKLLAQQSILVLNPNDPEIQTMKLYWVVNRDSPVVVPLETAVNVPEGQSLEMTALKELLWGPPAATNIGYTTAFPSAPEILNFPGRQPGWEPRVTLRHLEIIKGVATVEFSRELMAYDGISSRMDLILQQVTQTLKQFQEIKEVHLSIEGE